MFSKQAGLIKGKLAKRNLPISSSEAQELAIDHIPTHHSFHTLFFATSIYLTHDRLFTVPTASSTNRLPRSGSRLYPLQRQEKHESCLENDC